MGILFIIIYICFLYTNVFGDTKISRTNIFCTTKVVKVNSSQTLDVIIFINMNDSYIFNI